MSDLSIGILTCISLWGFLASMVIKYAPKYKEGLLKDSKLIIFSLPLLWLFSLETVELVWVSIILHWRVVEIWMNYKKFKET
jgi:hypothetical protein